MASTMSSYHRQKVVDLVLLVAKCKHDMTILVVLVKVNNSTLLSMLVHYCQMIAACAVPIELKRSAIDQTQNMYLHGEKSR